MIAATIVITIYLEEIPVFFGLNAIARKPIIKKRYAITESNRLIHVATVKTCGVANTLLDAVPPAGAGLVNSANASLIVLTNDVNGELGPIAYHVKATTKRSKTVTVLSASSSLGFTFEMRKTIATIPR